MKLLKKEELNLEIKDSFGYSFEISESGLYLIEIIASAKSWRQNLVSFKSFFQDDDLAVELDGIGFPRLNGKKDPFDGEVAWNGNNLKGVSKTNVIIAHLPKGEHKLSFSSDQIPVLEKLSVYKTENSEINYVPKENNPPQDGNRRQWITIILVNIPLDNLNIIASADKKEFDDEDIKLIIDGKTIINNDTRWHKNWYWCGRILKGQEKEFNEKLNFSKELHYVELWADKTPSISNIKINIGNFDNKKTSDDIIRQIQSLYKEIDQTIEFSKIPVPVENFNKYDGEIKVASSEFNVEPALLKATIAQESSFGNAIDHDDRYIGESGLMGLEKKNSIVQLTKLGYSFNYNNIEDVVRASAAYYKWLISIKLKNFKDTRNPLKLYTQYSKNLKAENTKAPGIKEFLYYYFYYK